jgi:hypothetical protein
LLALGIAAALSGCPLTTPKSHHVSVIPPIPDHPKILVHKVGTKWELVDPADLVKHINDVSTVAWGLDPAERTPVETLSVSFWWQSPFASGSELATVPPTDLESGSLAAGLAGDSQHIYPYKLTVIEKGHVKYAIDPGIIIDGPRDSTKAP